MPKFLSCDAINYILLAELQFSVKNNQILHHVLYSVCDVTQFSFMEQLMQLDIPYNRTVSKKQLEIQILWVKLRLIYTSKKIFQTILLLVKFFPIYSTHTEK